MTVTFFDGVTVTVEAALSAATGLYGAYDSAVYDTATYGPDVIWTDISAYVQSIKIDRQFDREVAAWRTGTATIVLRNQDGRFSPDNLSGPYVTSGVTQVRPWRPVRVQATYSGTTYTLYYGDALDWIEGWTVNKAGKGVAICTVPCVDALGRLGAFDGVELVSQGAGETTGRRIHRVLDNAGFTGTRAIDLGSVTVQATTLAANAATEIKLVADSEGGSVFVDADGAVVFERAYALMENARSNTIQATFGDGAGELKYAGAELAYSGDLVKNIAAFARVGSTTQTADDASSRSLYGDRREARTDLVCETDAQTLNLARFFVERFRQPEKRITSITVLPRRDPSTLYPQVLGRRVRDLVRVKRQPPGGHTVTRDCHIAGVHHTIDKSTGTWETSFDLWSATVYQTYANSLYDTAKYDTAAYFF